MKLIFQTPQNVNQNYQSENKEIQKQIDALIELKCKQLGKGTAHGKYNAIHLEQWMKGQLDSREVEETPEIEPVYEEWTAEQLNQRSKELQLIDEEGNLKPKGETKRIDNKVEEVIFSDHDQSPSKSTTTESQVSLVSNDIFEIWTFLLC